jgi:hypothetical protein
LLVRRGDSKSAITVPVFTANIRAVAFSRDASKIVVASDEPEILVFDTQALFDAFATKIVAKKVKAKK